MLLLIRFCITFANIIQIRIIIMKNIKYFYFILTLFLFSSIAFAQDGHLKGQIHDAINNEPLPFANVLVVGADKGDL